MLGFGGLGFRGFRVQGLGFSHFQASMHASLLKKGLDFRV